MAVHLEDDRLTLHLGDCVEVMAAMPPESIDAIVTDPPYGLDFMGKKWDTGAVAFDVATWREALRVLKPGGHLLAFGGTRTFHRLTCAIEDAGFEVRDCLSWLYGSGFPKSLDVSKAIDKAAGAEREVVGVDPGKLARRPNPWGGGENGDVAYGDYSGGERSARITAPATPEAREWEGWGSALKPAWEPIVVARKPLAGTVAANVLKHGTGALNVDGCRVAHASDDDLAVSLAKNPGRDDAVTSGVYGAGRPQQSVNTAGRWPANVVLDEAAAEALGEPSRFFATMTACGDESRTAERTSDGASPGVGRSDPSASTDGSGSRPTAPSRPGTTSTTLTATPSTTTSGTSRWSSEAATRHTTEPSGLSVSSATDSAPVVSAANGSPSASSTTAPTDHVRATADPARPSTCANGGHATANDMPSTCAPTEREAASRFFYTAKASTAERDGATHPTVKPLALMRWCVRLVTPPGGVVLDPFAGSGTTLIAARDEGFRAVGIEREPEYAAMAAERYRRRYDPAAATWDRGNDADDQMSLLGGAA